MPGKYMRGALVEFQAPTFLAPVPNVIVFQYNPETITHAWTQAAPSSDSGQNPQAVKSVPGESFTMSISMDAGDTIADGSVVTAGLAQVSGVYSRLAALEMLQYPTDTFGGGLLGSVSAGISVGGISLFGSSKGQDNVNVPKSVLPVVLFVWGPGRIVPVRITSLSITEKLYDELLNPTHADAQLTLQVLTPQELGALTGVLGQVAKVAYTYSQGLRQALAVANLANAAEGIIGMLPI